MDIVVLANRYKVHHFRNLEERFAGRFAYEESYDPAAILKHKPALVVCFDEHYCELGNAIGRIRSEGVATLQVLDGILEWRIMADTQSRTAQVILPIPHLIALASVQSDVGKS